MSDDLGGIGASRNRRCRHDDLCAGAVLATGPAGSQDQVRSGQLAHRPCPRMRPATQSPTTCRAGECPGLQVGLGPARVGSDDHGGRLQSRSEPLPTRTAPHRGQLVLINQRSKIIDRSPRPCSRATTRPTRHERRSARFSGPGSPSAWWRCRRRLFAGSLRRQLQRRRRADSSASSAAPDSTTGTGVAGDIAPGDDRANEAGAGAAVACAAAGADYHGSEQAAADKHEHGHGGYWAGIFSPVPLLPKGLGTSDVAPRLTGWSSRTCLK
jgi:hypothetical protein